MTELNLLKFVGLECDNTTLWFAQNIVVLTITTSVLKQELAA